MVSKSAIGVALLSLLLSPTANAFAPSPLAAMRGKSFAAVSARMRPAVRRSAVSMSMEGVESAQMLLSAVQNVPFVDELTGEPQGFTAPVNHFISVISLWVLFALPVWSAAYKQAGAQGPEWFGVSQVLEDVPGIGRVAKAAPEYDGPTFGEGLSYVFSFLWKPPILIAWKPREDLDQSTMDPARDTVVSKLYKGFGGATDKAALYDEEDQLLIKSEIQVFEETPLGKRREALAEKNGWFEGNPAFGRSLIEFSEVTKKQSFGEKTVNIRAEELAALRAAASAPVKTSAAPARAAPKPAPKPAAPKPAPARPAASGAAAAAAKAAAEAAARARAAQEEAARKRAAAEAQAAAAKQQAAAAAAAKAAAAVAARSAPASKVGMGTMPVPKSGGILSLTQPVAKSVGVGTVPVPRSAPAPKPAPAPRVVATSAPAVGEKRRFSPADKEGKGLPVATEPYDFPAMQLFFGEGTLKDGLVPKWQPEIEFDNWGNPLPTASEATKKAYQKKKEDQKLKELSNKSTYPYDPNAVLAK